MKALKLAMALITSVFTDTLLMPAADTPLLPWQREPPLREAARAITLESTLNPTNPQPDIFGEPFNGPAMSINSLKMRTTLWGPPNRITISLNKNNVWDRRLHEFTAPTSNFGSHSRPEFLVGCL